MDFTKILNDATKHFKEKKPFLTGERWRADVKNKAVKPDLPGSDDVDCFIAKEIEHEEDLHVISAAKDAVIFLLELESYHGMPYEVWKERSRILSKAFGKKFNSEGFDMLHKKDYEERESKNIKEFLTYLDLPHEVRDFLLSVRRLDL